MKGDATGAAHDKGASKMGPHVHVREGEQSAENFEEERKKKDEPEKTKEKEVAASSVERGGRHIPERDAR